MRIEMEQFQCRCVWNSFQFKSIFTNTIEKTPFSLSPCRNIQSNKSHYLFCLHINCFCLLSYNIYHFHSPIRSACILYVWIVKYEDYLFVACQYRFSNRFEWKTMMTISCVLLHIQYNFSLNFFLFASFCTSSNSIDNAIFSNTIKINIFFICERDIYRSLHFFHLFYDAIYCGSIDSMKSFISLLKCMCHEISIWQIYVVDFRGRKWTKLLWFTFSNGSGSLVWFLKENSCNPCNTACNKPNGVWWIRLILAESVNQNWCAIETINWYYEKDNYRQQYTKHFFHIISMNTRMIFPLYFLANIFFCWIRSQGFSQIIITILA